MNNLNIIVHCEDCIHSKESIVGGDMLFCKLHKIARIIGDFCSNGKLWEKR